jgi:hypothetical protein
LLAYRPESALCWLTDYHSVDAVFTLRRIEISRGFTRMHADQIRN